MVRRAERLAERFATRGLQCLTRFRIMGIE